MKAKLAVIALGALVLMANGANAQHRTSGQTHVRHLSPTFGQAYGYAPAKRRSCNRREALTNRIRKEASHTQIRTEGRTRHLAGHVVSSRSHYFMHANEPGENAGLVCLCRASF
jgi:hypothetical protein